MPANLTPQYYALEKEFKKENDPYEKLRLAKELMAIIPKHKGTEKLQAELKAKISQLKKQIEGGGKKHGVRQADTLSHIDREGAAQVILIGPPNSGKSSLVDSLTHAKPLIGDYPYTTIKPLAGMMVYDTVPFQVIDTPPISEELLETFLLSLIRQADLVAVVVDVSTPGFDKRLKVLFDRLEEKRVILTPEIPEEVEDARFAYKKSFFAAHKFLDENGDIGLEKIKTLYPDFNIVPTSILEDETLENFKAMIFNSLNIIRIYTKRVGHEPDFNDPIILPNGGTVEDAAYALHKDFAYKLQFAKIWGDGKHEGQRVKNSFVLTDKDIIEFHI
ncbi:MAG: TGS domain-containing protein [candidate division Zixibacteria bacterium]|nr:TGS domain-containing protein [candidate division Zixibacteria bacterium]